MDGEAVYVSAKVGLLEMLLSGCTTASDHLYMYPNGAKIDDEIRAARELGMRFHPTRGSMSVGESKGGLPPDHLVEEEEAILADCKRVIETFHDPTRFSMLRIGLAPCSPFSVSAELMKKTVQLARSYEGVHLHTHLCETKDEEEYCLSKFNQLPLAYVESLDWKGADVWFAHMVHLQDQELQTLAKHHSGICYCPSSNMILASGIPPVIRMLELGIPVSLGLDGSASNDGNHMLGEVRQAMLLQRVQQHPSFPARAALRIATRGGAKVLGRDDLGSLAPGQAADFIAFRIDGIHHAGGQSDLVASLLTGWPLGVWLSVINGKVVVERGEVLSMGKEDIAKLVQRHNEISKGMFEG